MTWKVYRFIGLDPAEFGTWATDNNIPRLMSSSNRQRGEASDFTVCVFSNETLIRLTWSDYLFDK